MIFAVFMDRPARGYPREPRGGDAVTLGAQTERERSG